MAIISGLTIRCCQLREVGSTSTQGHICQKSHKQFVQTSQIRPESPRFGRTIDLARRGDTWLLNMDSKVSLNIIKHWQALCSDIVFADVAPLLIQNGIITVGDYEDIKSQADKGQTETLLLVLLKKDESALLKFAEALERDYEWLAEKMREGIQGKDETDATPVTRMDADVTSEEEDRDCRRLNAINRSNCLNNGVSTKSNKWEKRRTIKLRVKNRLKAKVHNSEAVISSSTDLVAQKKNEEITDEVIAILRRSSLLSRSWTIIAHSLGLTDRVQDIKFRVLVYNEHLSMCVVYLIKDWVEMFPETATLSRLIEVLRNEKFNKVADELTEKLYAKPVMDNVKTQ